MPKDANDIAKDFEVRSREEFRSRHQSSPRVGTLSIWTSSTDYLREEDPEHQVPHQRVDVSKPGLLLSYDSDGSVEAWVLTERMVFTFVPDRDDAGE